MDEGKKNKVVCHFCYFGYDGDYSHVYDKQGYGGR